MRICVCLCMCLCVCVCFLFFKNKEEIKKIRFINFIPGKRSRDRVNKLLSMVHALSGQT